ncbi:MAG: cytochrome c3 family protein [Elusimicrobia bacterium]|nr:cytochrome c3 family protein [Elusimicrobiota bacterium]
MIRQDDKLGSPLLALVLGGLLFEALSGLFLPWAGAARALGSYALLLHTLAGAAVAVPLAVYGLRHWRAARASEQRRMVQVGLSAMAVLAAAMLSGFWTTGAALFGSRVSPVSARIHAWTSYAAILFVAVHLTVALRRLKLLGGDASRSVLAARAGAAFGVLVLATAVLALAHRPTAYSDATPGDYGQKYGANPFAPSNAMTATAKTLDPRRLAPASACKECHAQIFEEWSASAHHWSSSEPFYRAVEGLMVKEMGREATRYCASCHDGTAFLAGQIKAGGAVPALASDEGTSCSICHAIRGLTGATADGNANYLLAPPSGYLFDNAKAGLPKAVESFLVKAWPEPHRADFAHPFQASPEMCSTCHKQFIDQRINNFGWVQLQNQYDDWRKGKFNVAGHPEKSLTCKDCHMRLLAMADPARGTAGKHRSHRFIGANQAVPTLRGDKEQVRLTEEWLQGRAVVPEIQSRWATGPAVAVHISASTQAASGGMLRWQVVMSSNKVGHNYPTGPLDLIETWLEVTVRDAKGKSLYSSGSLDPAGNADPKAFYLRAIGVDENGKPVLRHELWHMVGQRSKRALFSGYSDSAPYEVRLPKGAAGPVVIEARLRYRKFRQAFADIVLGKGKPPLPVTDVGVDRVEVPLGRVTGG